MRTLKQIDREMNTLRAKKEDIQERLRVLARERDEAFAVEEATRPRPKRGTQVIG